MSYKSLFLNFEVASHSWNKSTWPTSTFSFYIVGFDFLNFYLDILFVSNLIEAIGLFLCFQCLFFVIRAMNLHGMSLEIFCSLQFSRWVCVELLFIP